MVSIQRGYTNTKQARHIYRYLHGRVILFDPSKYVWHVPVLNLALYAGES
jgi:hypothetical protein